MKKHFLAIVYLALPIALFSQNDANSYFEEGVKCIAEETNCLSCGMYRGAYYMEKCFQLVNDEDVYNILLKLKEMGVQVPFFDSVFDESLKSRADRGDSQAQFQLATCLHFGLGCDVDLYTASRYYNSAAQDDDSPYQKIAGFMASHIIMKHYPDYVSDNTIELMEAVAGTCFPAACYEYGCWLLNSDKKKQQKQGITFLEASAANSYLPADLMLYRAYSNGDYGLSANEGMAQYFRNDAFELMKLLGYE